MKAAIRTLVVIGMVVTFASSAQAESKKKKDKDFKKDHPRRAEVLGRANKQENINNAAAVNGKLTNGQARKLDREDQAVKAQEQRQAAADGGHITKAEQAQDNREMNKIAEQRKDMEQKDFAKEHPRRAEVLGRANHQENVNNSAAVDGKLTDGQARKLDREDQAVKRQEQRQAAADGGHITKAEQAKDNREMNQIAEQRKDMEQKDASNQSQ